FEKKMIQQIQRAYYVNAENPSLDEILYLCAERAGLNRVRFLNDYTGTGIEAELQKEIQFTRQMGVSSFPSLRLDFNKKVFPIHIDYNNEQKIFEQISKYVGDYDESCNSK
ncbi:MAG: DsbA family protein, partial [Methylococcales bacterium]|nr:DsbA family protein [Methylococcales bacterium]